jgi:hypothetical protein
MASRRRRLERRDYLVENTRQRRDYSTPVLFFLAISAIAACLLLVLAANFGAI